MVQYGPKHRKIPVPRRHGVRDPLKRLADQEAAVKDKINNPPKEYDVQEVSNRFKRFVELKDNANQPRKKGLRKKQKSKIKISNTVLHKQPMESEESFLQRATRIQHDRAVESKFGAKFGVEVERNEKTGAIHIVKRKGMEVDGMLKKISDDSTSSKFKKMKAKARAEAVKLRKAQAAEMKVLKKQKALEEKHEEEEFLLQEYQYEKVPFGEVVKEPPTLHTLPRRATRDGVPRPGNKGLLLSAMLQPQEEAEDDESAPKKSSKKQAKQSKIDLKGKRKNLPVATRMKIEREQQSVIEMYRRLKKKPKE